MTDAEKQRQEVRNAIGRRLATENPHWSGAQIHDLATKLADCGAYDVAPDGSLRANGNMVGLQAARKVSSAFVMGLARGSTAHLSPAERTMHQLAAMGLSLDDGDSDRDETIAWTKGFAGNGDDAA